MAALIIIARILGEGADFVSHHAAESVGFENCHRCIGDPSSWVQPKANAWAIPRFIRNTPRSGTFPVAATSRATVESSDPQAARFGTVTLQSLYIVATATGERALSNF